MLVLNRTRTAQPEKTVVILGSAHGGAAMVGRVLMALGVHIDRRPESAHADAKLNRALGLGDFERVREIVAARDAAHRLWGWRYFSAVEYAGSGCPGVWTKHLRNPHVVAIFADPFVTASRQNVAMPSDIFPAMEDVVHHLHTQLTYLGRHNGPLLMCSHEKAKAAPESFVRALDAFLGLDAAASWPAAVSQIDRSTAGTPAESSSA